MGAYARPIFAEPPATASSIIPTMPAFLGALWLASGVSIASAAAAAAAAAAPRRPSASAAVAARAASLTAAAACSLAASLLTCHVSPRAVE